MNPKPSNPAHLRREYQRHELSESAALADPIAQFSAWFDDAISAELADVNAMVVATANSSGAPSARVMLLKGFDDRGFVFFTNYASRKGRELEANGRAALVFFWQELERQVRIEGTIAKTSVEESREYFASRPRESQIAAWTSHQDRVIPSRAHLEKRHEELTQSFAGKDVPFPDFWGGYRVTPSVIEFWQGRPGRLHDRLVYCRASDGKWEIVRLEP